MIDTSIISILILKEVSIMEKKKATETQRKASEIDVMVGKHILQRRKMMGLSQDGLASAIGVTFQQIQKYETGSNRVSASRLKLIADALEVTPNFFYDAKPVDYSKSEFILENVLRETPEPVQKAIVQLAKVINKEYQNYING